LSDDGAVLAVGASAWTGIAGYGQGAVYIYDWNGSSWAQRGSVLTASDAGLGYGFGSSVALSNNDVTLAVGSSGWDAGIGSEHGGVYTYNRYWAGKFLGVTNPAKIIIGDEAIPVENIRKVIIGDQEIYIYA
jgi:hypothetical protein